MLTENISYLRRKHKLSQQALADKIGVPRTTLSGWERGSAEPNIEMLIRLANEFELRIDDLLRRKIETDELEILKNKDLRVLAISVDSHNRQNIELVDSKAEAGYLLNFSDPEYIKDLPKIHFPQLPEGSYRAFEVQGDSMLPVAPGSIVICRYVESLDQLKDGMTYVIVTRENSLVYKRIKCKPSESKIMAISDNATYRPYEISFDEIDEIWQFHAQLGFEDLKFTVDQLLDIRLDDIHLKVNNMHEKMISWP